MDDLIELQLDTLLARNARGRLTATHGIEARPAPRLFLGRSLHRNAWGVREDLDRALFGQLSELCEAEPGPTELGAGSPPACAERAREWLAPVAFEFRGPAYLLTDELPDPTRAREAPSHLVREWLAPFANWKADDPLDPDEPIAFAFVGEEPAALCHSARGTPRAAEAGVETRPEFRGRGLAVEATACWARAIQRSGRVALYSTSWDNEASQGVARRLGARIYGEDWHLT